MSKTYLIYKFTSPSGKSYIGQTCRFKRRKYEHQYVNTNSLIHKSIEKYGLENFIEEILEENLTLDEANIFEELYITEHNTLVPNGYNIRNGGNNLICSDETKIKISENHCGMLGKTHSDITKQKQRDAKLGKYNPNFEKFGELNIFFGKHHTEISKQKQRDKMCGRIHTDEENEKQSISQSKKYVVTRPTGEEDFIIGLPKYCKENNLAPGAMTNIARGKSKYHKGFKCRYATFEDEILFNY